MASEDLYREFHEAGEFHVPETMASLIERVRDTLAAATVIAIRENCLALQRLAAKLRGRR